MGAIAVQYLLKTGKELVEVIYLFFFHFSFL